MNILFTTDNYPPHVNGIVSHVIPVKKELEKRGHKVFVITPKIGRKKQKEKDVFQLPSFPIPTRAKDLFTIPFHTGIEKKILNTPIDIVHNHLFLTGYFGIRVAQKKNIPIVATFHTFARQYVDWIAPWLKPITHPVANMVVRDYFAEHDLVIAPSQKAIGELQKIEVQTPLHLIHNGIDINLFSSTLPSIFRDRFFIDLQRPLVLLTGIIEKGKNVDLAIKSIDIARKKIPNIQLVIIGDGKLRKSMEKMVFKLGLTRNIFFTGFLDAITVASANKAADVILFTSDTDTSPTVLMEALAAEKPIVSVKDKATYDFVKNNKNGFLVPKNATQLADSLTKILSNSTLQKSFAVESKKLSSNFSLQTCVDSLEKVYSQCIKKKNAHI